MDVIAAYYQTDTIEWFENTDGQGTFADGLTVTDTADAANSVFATDIDGDGNIDILSASHNDDTIAWYKNDGSETFVKYVISSDTVSADSVYAADLDGDGDMDVLSASYSGDKIAWHENTDGSGTFGAKQTISTDLVDADFVYAADLDGDGDMDVLSASNGDDNIAWKDNTDGS